MMLVRRYSDIQRSRYCFLIFAFATSFMRAKRPSASYRVQLTIMENVAKR